MRAAGGGIGGIAVIIFILMRLLGGGSDGSSTGSYTQQTAAPATAAQSQSSTGSSSSGSTAAGTSSSGTSYSASDFYSSLFGGSSSGSSSSGWKETSNVGKLNTEVAQGVREKYTDILGDGKDVTTIMVYMCGTDLESKNSMATMDLQEMLKASFDEHINLIVYTGGCKKWQNNVVSSSKNQIYQIKSGKLICLEQDMGSAAMTKPENLTSFIQYCTKNFPANRNDLILWDHGGGSLSGYGYDEKNTAAGSMTLSGISSALKNAGTSFDFIGFDACLMATAENGLMLSQYADYMIASEETEPGVGWYYTDWLTAYSKDPSMSTPEIGKKIADDFVRVCAKSCKGQKTTLSVVDLAELSATVPDKLKSFSTDLNELIKSDSSQKVAAARSSSREFAQSSKIDQVDFVNLLQNLGTDEAKSLETALLNAVKYNNTSSDMTNAYGLSIYYPLKKLSSVDTAVQTYTAIGMEEEYIKAIRNAATVSASAQTTAYGSGSGSVGSPLESLFGTGSYQSAAASSGSAVSMDSDAMLQLIGSLLSTGMMSGGNNGRMAFLEDSELSKEELAGILDGRTLDASTLFWTENAAGQQVISLTEDQWSLITDLEENLFYDDGEGYIDLGLDNVFDFDADGNLLEPADHTWLAINGQPVAYYYISTMEEGEDYTITGYVPALLNGEKVRLLLTFDKENPYGYIAGAASDYDAAVTATEAKAVTVLETGDTLDFLCDYYSYDGDYMDSYRLGDPMTVTDTMEISNVDVGGKVRISYCFTDLYGQNYWTEVVPE